MKYYQATVTTTGEYADTVSVLLIECGSEGVSVADHEDIKKVLAEHTWDYADESLYDNADEAVYVSGYYPEDHDFAPLIEKLNVFKAINGANAGPLELDLKKIDPADYENEWKKYYVPIELDKIVIVPQWHSYAGEKSPVYIDPGMAFGTGSHETTKLCLKFLERLDVAGKRCADIGCGSGILGVAALKLGADSCFMADIDEQAVRATLKNCAASGVEKKAVVVQGSLPDNVQNEFFVLLANITADVLISLKNGFFAAVEDGGYVVMSGIINSRAEEVKKAYSEKFELVSQETDGEWQGMMWKKK